ncbi:MAG: PHP domain-containing protein [Chloroflexi bacterium]|nr:PHP domain-containing protein [Chloroflexota bacterium]
MRYEHHGRLTLADKARADYVYLPFEVPPGAEGISMSYSYSNPMPADESWGGNTIDVGLFSPGDLGFPCRNFRGWSGSFRQEVHLGLGRATPGYLPGPIEPGRWHVQLGLYKLSQAGCDYHVVVGVEVSPAEQKAVLQGQRRATFASSLSPAASRFSPPRWLRCDLHSHTRHSDGANSLKELTDYAKARGLDFLAVTEHNTVSHLPCLHVYDSPAFLALPGEEVTTYYGHANVWGIEEWVDFRCRQVEEVQVAAARARAQGGLFSVNHPKDGGPPWCLGADLDFDCVEVWQGPWWLSNHQSLAWWDELLRQGRRVVAVGGSDLHRVGTPDHPYSHELGNPTTWVYASELSVNAIVDALRKGHVFLSRDVDGPRLELQATATGSSQRAMMGDSLTMGAGQGLLLEARVEGGEGCLVRLISARGEERRDLVEHSSQRFEYVVAPRESTYYRIELIEPPEADLNQEPAALMVQAMSNPIYVAL